LRTKARTMSTAAKIDKDLSPVCIIVLLRASLSRTGNSC
jgi:hypothetical protein